MPLIRLLYTSRATQEVGYDDLSAILASATQRNASLEISGALCYGNGRFLQALEGDPQRVNTLYHQLICRDERHDDLQLLGVEAIDFRAFALWSMNLVRLDDAMYTDILFKYAAQRIFEPELLSSGSSLCLLQEIVAAKMAKGVKVA